MVASGRSSANCLKQGAINIIPGSMDGGFG